MAYKAAEYIQLNNTYFITSLGLKTNTSIYAKFSPVEVKSGNNFMFGWNFGTATFTLNAHNTLYFRVYSGSYVNNYACPFTLEHLYDTNFYNTGITITDLTTSSVSSITYTNNVTETTNVMYIGSLNGYNQPIQKMNLYELIVYDDDVIVAHYLPYGDTETGYGLLYDTVSGNYLTANEPSKTTAFFPQFSIEPESISFDYTGGTSALTITAEDGWTASTNDGWLTLSSTAGTGDSTINITAAANSGVQRNGMVSITDGNETLTCSVTQEKRPYLVPIYNMYINGNRVN